MSTFSQTCGSDLGYSRFVSFWTHGRVSEKISEFAFPSQFQLAQRAVPQKLSVSTSKKNLSLELVKKYTNRHLKKRQSTFIVGLCT